MEFIDLALALIFCFAVIHAAIMDMTTYKIPNLVSAILAIGFVGYVLVNWSSISLIGHLGLAAIVLIISGVAWNLKVLGGGDVKFLTAVTLWMGPNNILPFLIILTIISFFVSVLLLLLGKWNSQIQSRNFPRIFKNMVKKATEHACPYGLPITIAALTLVPSIFSS